MFDHLTYSVQQTVFISFSALSTILSATVVMVGLASSKNLSDIRPFSYAIFFMSFSDTIASIGNCFGYPDNGTVLCAVQGFLVIYFFLATWYYYRIEYYRIKM